MKSGNIKLISGFVYILFLFLFKIADQTRCWIFVLTF